MADTLTALELTPPVSVTTAQWTIIGGSTSHIGGRVPSIEAAQRAVERAEHLGGVEQTTNDLDIDSDAPDGSGSLVLTDPIEFVAGAAELLPGSGARLDFAAGVNWQFDEVVLWAVGAGDHELLEQDAVELAQQRAATIVSYLQFRGAGTVEIEVTERNRGAAAVRGAARLRPNDRVIGVRLVSTPSPW